MFTLVQYHNDTYCVVPSKKVHKLNRKECLVNCKGGKYAAFFVSQNDCKSDLLDLKIKKEDKNASSLSFPTKFSRPIKCREKTSASRFSKNTSSNTPTSTKSLRPSKPNSHSTSASKATNRLNHFETNDTLDYNSKTNCVFGKECSSEINFKDSEIEGELLASISSKKLLNFDSDEPRTNSTFQNGTLERDLNDIKTDGALSFQPKINCLFKHESSLPKTNSTFQHGSTINLLDYKIDKEFLSIDPRTNITSQNITPIKNLNDINPDDALILVESTHIEGNLSCVLNSIGTSEPVQNEKSNTMLNSTNVSKVEESVNIENFTDISSIQISNTSIYLPNSSADKTEDSKDFINYEISTEVTPDVYKSSIQENDSTDYFPNTTIDTSQNGETTQENTSTNISKIDETLSQTVDIIETPLTVTSLEVPYSNNKSKKHFCIFCKKMQTKFARHIFLKHSNEKDVKIAMALPKKYFERVKIINNLRKIGDFEHNTCKDLNSGVLIVSRRQQLKAKNVADDYVCCKICKGFYSKTTLRIHLAKCGAKKNSRSNLIEGRKLTQYVHYAANDVLKTKIFPSIRIDEIGKSIRYDELIIKFGNKLSEKYSLPHQYDLVKSQLRLLGRFKIELHKLDPDVTELKQIFKPHLFDKCVKSLRAVAGWNILNGFETPAVASNLTTLIKKCAKTQSAEFIKSGSKDLKEDLENFMVLWEEEIPVLNKKALEDQINQKRVKKVVLPTREDIQKLYSYLKIKIFNSIEKLSKKFCYFSWTQLVEASLIFIQIFNRRRAGEIERLTLENYANKEIITTNMEENLLQSMTTESVAFAKQFVRLTLRGKLGRTVSVLLNPICVKALDLVLKYRKKAGIPDENVYIFSKPNVTELGKPYYRACTLLRKFAEESGAEIPTSLRGTTLRKHIATYTSLHNIEDATIDKLANFMGHHKDIHKNIYRVSITVSEVTTVSKILLAAVGENEENIEQSVDTNELITTKNTIRNENSNGIEMLEEDAEDCIPTSRNSSISSKKKRSTSPFGKTKRIRWKDDEKEAIRSMFGDLQVLERLPSLAMCQAAIAKHKVLKRRTPQQLKTWIDNQRRYKGN